MSQGSITGAQGSFVLGIDEENTPKAEAALENITYAPGAPISGGGQFTVLDSLLVYQGDTHEILVTPGTTGTATVNNDQLETVDGDLSIRLDETGGPLVLAMISANYQAGAGTSASISGGGQASVVSEIEMTEPGSEYGFFLMPSEGINAVFTSSELESVNGT